MQTVLVVDDQENIRLVVNTILRRNGYICVEAADGRQALHLFKSVKPDLIILDVMMPEVDGFEVCENIRREDETVPVLFLSAKDDMVDKRMGYRLGADDYMTKPFNEEELVLRIGALLRRARLASDTSVKEPAPLQAICVGDIEIDLLRHHATVEGKSIDLTPTEFRLLSVLVENAGVVLTKEDLVEQVWGKDYLGDSVSVPTHIRHLRSKVEKNPSEPRYIETVWGFGYRFKKL